MYGKLANAVCMAGDWQGGRNAEAESGSQAYRTLTVPLPPDPKCSLKVGPRPFLQNLYNFTLLRKQYTFMGLTHFQGYVELEQRQINVSCHIVTDHTVDMLL